jgi:hypothetical protein
MVLTASFVLSPAIGLFCHRRPRKLVFANLTPASRRQDHTTSPSASKTLSSAAPLASIASNPASVTIAIRPLSGVDGCGYKVIWDFGKPEYFFKRDWTGRNSLIRLGKLDFTRKSAERGRPAALDHALADRKPRPASLIHHSDRGVQYASTDYRQRLAGHDITVSMSRPGNPYDNAKAESFMKTLKTEEVDGRRFKNIEHARRSISVFIGTIYNTERLHSALGYRPPLEFETNFALAMNPK